MPYTQEEAQKLTFYTNFRDDLREEYLVKVKESSDLSTPFRDDNNVLLSYENIENNYEIMGLGRAHDFIIIFYILMCSYVFPYIFRL